MPPWFADAELRSFRERTQLSDARNRRRSPRGPTPARPPATRRTRRAPKHFENGWNIKPDVIVEMPKPFELPATGTINYKYILVKTNFNEDMWVVAAEMRPGNPTVLHHGKVWVRPPGSSWMKDAVPGEAYENETQRDIIGTQLDGRRQRHPRQVQSRPRRAALRSGRRGEVRAEGIGSRVRDALHGHRQGGRPMCRSSASCSPKTHPTKRYYFHAGPTASNLAIPAGDGNAEVVSEVTLGATGRLVYAQPHMHLRGKDFELRVVSPERRKADRAQGQVGFRMADGLSVRRSRSPLPKGTKLRFITHFDNSPANRFNPDPTKKVVWGPQNWDEMSNCFIGVLFDRTVNVAKAFMRSGASTLPRGESGPTLSMAEHAAGEVAPAFNASGDTFEKPGQGQGQ